MWVAPFWGNQNSQRKRKYIAKWQIYKPLNFKGHCEKPMGFSPKMAAKGHHFCKVWNCLLFWGHTMTNQYVLYNIFESNSFIRNCNTVRYRISSKVRCSNEADHASRCIIWLVMGYEFIIIGMISWHKGRTKQTIL